MNAKVKLYLSKYPHFQTETRELSEEELRDWPNTRDKLLDDFAESGFTKEGIRSSIRYMKNGVVTFGPPKGSDSKAFRDKMASLFEDALDRGREDIKFEPAKEIEEDVLNAVLIAVSSTGTRQTIRRTKDRTTSIERFTMWNGVRLTRAVTRDSRGRFVKLEIKANKKVDRSTRVR